MRGSPDAAAFISAASGSGLSMSSAVRDPLVPESTCAMNFDLVSSFCHMTASKLFAVIARDADDGILVALVFDAAVALLDVCRLPGRVEMVHPNQEVLHVGADPYLAGRTQDDADLAGADPREQFGLLGVVGRIMDRGDFLGRNPHGGKARLDVGVEVDALRRGIGPRLAVILKIGLDLR